MLSVILPAHDEEATIGDALTALLASDPPPGGVEVIVVANGCRDGTVAVAETFCPTARALGWGYQLVDRPDPGKPGALNAGDARAAGDIRAYLDADITVDPALLSDTVTALSRPDAAYAGARPRIDGGADGFSRAYARFWSTVPFMATGVPGAGYFAVNAAGRARWSVFPDIVSDDTFARLHFAPHERHLLASSYDWPVVQGFRTLIRVRRRQDAGVAEIARRYPDLADNDDTPPMGLRGLSARAATDPAGFAAYVAVALAVRASPAPRGWDRGR